MLLPSLPMIHTSPNFDVSLGEFKRCGAATESSSTTCRQAELPASEGCRHVSFQFVGAVFVIGGLCVMYSSASTAQPYLCYLFLGSWEYGGLVPRTSESLQPYNKPRSLNLFWLPDSFVVSSTKAVTLDNSTDLLLATMARNNSIVQDEEIEEEDWGQADQRPPSSMATKHGRTELR